ncbi:MAG: methionyl-tRNA formyltransferase [Bacilli bacterium]|nr:methionyl-tRNA formyltransferase [Bacilli bacterium]
MNIEDIKVNKKIKVVFMGTPEFAVPILEELINNYDVRGVITQPDKPFGRDGKLASPPVKKIASANNILVFQPLKVGDILEDIKGLDIDIIVTCAYGQIVPSSILNLPRLGCINVHASLLPKLRGGAPIHRAIIEGHSKTGITIMYMNEKMDAGDIIAQEEMPILENDTASSMHDKLSNLGASLLIKTLPSIIDETNERIKQDSSLVTYAFNIKREDEKLDFSKTAREIYNQVRGLNSWPGAYCLFEGKVLKVWECRVTNNYFPEKFDGQITNIYDDGIGVKVSNGEVVLTLIQLEGKTKMPASQFVNGINNNGDLIGKVLD